MGDLIRQAEDYENEIADLHNRLDIAEYDKERYKEEITILEAENKEELTNEKAIAFLQDNGWLVEHDRIMTSGMENKREWIPVSERLPEDGRPVLIYAWNVHHVVARYDSFRTENGYKKCWVTADAWNGNTEIKHDVIAWMPLPEPYKAERGEE